ncbi:diheme cytochrome c [Hydrogenimonas thermophila]|uniref:Dihaem cytochrome c n=1 Tax=Hydrogenimonas thermophila TaxID=223786 RepID=A0A1I5UEA6_9BACT|nr:diheme cytochrome c [Hydrogenimonas thermophila]WOE69184.1 diheme cytochrome c [Hydrogenimonas thermophila]WOE71694.1 diheme cytochrome c [Hydrogenimonas thermophila]SFP93564.1 Dihaem cytochrome c [Hydrogenimonas thermophila]
MKKFFLFAAVAMLAVGSVVIFADEDNEHERKEVYHKKSYLVSGNTKLYKNECGACHMAYQPEFLPKRSWKKMMLTLEDHFGTDATLEKEEFQQILEYLLENASDNKAVYGDIGKMGKRIYPNTSPLRISETPYFKKEHREIPKRFIKQKAVKSLANCNACHTNAQSGSYSEKEIYIPNYGRWDD